MKRRITKRQIAIVAEYINISVTDLEKLYQMGIIKHSRFLELWNNALYSKGIVKRYIWHHTKAQRIKILNEWGNTENIVKASFDKVSK